MAKLPTGKRLELSKASIRDGRMSPNANSRSTLEASCENP